MRAIGKVTAADYEAVVRPLFDEARRDGRRLRLLYHFGPEFDGFTAGAILDDTRIGLRYMRLLERCAVVSDGAGVRESARLIGALLPCPVRVFGTHEWQVAVDWLGSRSHRTCLSGSSGSPGCS